MTDSGGPQGQTSECSDFTAASITLVLDAEDASPPNEPLPLHFRSSADAIDPRLAEGLKDIRASGSGQYSKREFRAVLDSGRVQRPLTVVDLRQESHGFLRIGPPRSADLAVAVSWYLERDWINIGKDLVSVVADENARLKDAAGTPVLVVQRIIKKTSPEDRLCRTQPMTMNPLGWASEGEVARELGLEYLRLPCTDHVRPRDSAVDAFVAFDAGLPRDRWLHFHCRAGDGRTTTFLVMHDILRNAPAVSLSVIVERQHVLGGIDVFGLPADHGSYKYPFAVERAAFLRQFYAYVCDAKSGGFAMTWSAWMARGPA